MQVPLQITLRHVAPSETLDRRIRRDADKLGEFHPNIISCHVVIEELALRKQQGRMFNVRLTVHVPDHDLVVNRDHAEDVHVALRDAFASMVRRLEDVARRQRREVKTHEDPRQSKLAGSTS